MNSFRRLQKEAFEWSESQFGSKEERGPEGPLNHLKKEIDEVLENQDDVEEWADVLLLVLDGMSRVGMSVNYVEDAAWDKLNINKRRKWSPPDADGVSEHVREAPETVEPLRWGTPG
jgi:hypothetical protein